MKTVWVKVGNTLHQTIDGQQLILEAPENKVYNLCFNSQSGELFLEEISDNFDFNFKIYGIQNQFIDHVMATYKGTSSNLGVLLDGKKGTGKTVTAKILATKFEKPIILVSCPFPGLQNFISKFSTECVFFFDEFEKTFGNNKKDDDGATSMLLSVMDGAYNTQCRQVFLLTTNNTFIDTNFLGRPSRIRYHKTFGNLELSTVLEYIEDNLVDKSRTNDVLELVDSLELSTIDTLKAIVLDFNLHPNVPVGNIREYLNLEFASHRYRLIIKYLPRNDPKFDTYSIKDFEEEISHVGDRYEEDGESYIHDYNSLGFSTPSWATSRNVYSFLKGDVFYDGKVIVPYDETTQTIITERYEYERRAFIKILNPSSRPSLYGSNLDEIF